MSPDQRTCGDCGHPMKPIRLIDKVQLGHTYLEYAVGESERGFWTAKFPVEGRIASYMCQQCGRITLYGERMSS